MFHLASSLADDVPLDRPAAADIALSFTLLAQAVCLFALFCPRHVVKHCFQGCQPRGPQWRSAASAAGSSGRSLLRGGFSSDDAGWISQR
jgi:hypothetical protein